MKSFFTFSLAVKEDSGPFGHVVNKVAESVQPATAHAVGVTSGATGMLLWAEYAKHLTVVVGLAVAIMAFAGGTFYALYWAAKMLREWREMLREWKAEKKSRRKD